MFVLFLFQFTSVLLQGHLRQILSHFHVQEEDRRLKVEFYDDSQSNPVKGIYVLPDSFFIIFFSNTKILPEIFASLIFSVFIIGNNLFFICPFCQFICFLFSHSFMTYKMQRGIYILTQIAPPDPSINSRLQNTPTAVGIWP